jgi:hypothetical protein
VVAVALQPQPIAVVLHFVQPVRASGTMVNFGGKSRSCLAWCYGGVCEYASFDCGDQEKGRPSVEPAA